MNERIKALKRQAEDYAGKYSVKHQVFGQALIDALDQKFAELIVRECADIAKHHVMNISTYADADFVDEQIKEHFGVEE